MTQNEAQKVIYADRNQDLTFALINDESNVKPNPGLILQQHVVTHCHDCHRRSRPIRG